MAARLGGDRVRFLKGRIQDLALDVDALQDWLARHPDEPELQARYMDEQRREGPLIADSSVDLVISNCVLNLVADSEKRQLVDEIYRVLKPGGRIAIADIVSDRSVPDGMKDDPELWSGCIAGVFHEAEMPAMFAAAGFHAVCYDKWDAQPWRVINGIEFRSVTLTAMRPAVADGADGYRTLIYRGPFDSVTDEDGRCYRRGERVSVPPDRYRLLTGPAYHDAFIDPLADEVAGQACCASGTSSGGCC